MDINSNDADVNANWYASMLGTFAKHEVDFFTPWSWKNGMYETVHLYSTYYKSISVKSTSDNEQLLSAFASTNETSDSVTIVFVNHSQSQTLQVSAQLNNFSLQDGSYYSYTLSNLPSNETFVSKNQNALVSSLSSASGGILNVSVPALSVKAVILTGNPLGSDPISLKEKDNLLSVKYLAEGNILCEYQLNQNSKLQIKLIDLSGKEIEKIVDKQLFEGLYTYTINRANLTSGIYIISVLEKNTLVASKKIKL
ncbi:MAG: T9SS type A sorting domain-containing protein, partial [Bacteroidales bacterium]|nr:T9SS type A sorting domain-containing protein [Bacteroidales bacterium]